MTTSFVSGLLVAGYAVVGLFFLRFWRESGDRLFAWFALAFALLAVQRAGLAMLAGQEHAESTETWFYALRALAYLVIIWAILDKNRRP
ncbi:MAG TPA: DUF5985 family protein [Longimicrobium sp.]|nr:DUF5985 family protein [Longimicrobium sp.]